MQDYEIARNTLAALLERHEITIECVFVPFSKSRHYKQWESLNWKVTIKRKGKAFHTCDYSQGVAHCPASKKAWNNSHTGKTDSQLKSAAIWEEIETGKIAKRGLGNQRAAYPSSKSIPGPNAVDVLSSLALDSSVLDYATYEDWAADFGYDSDSRKGESIYRACLETALKMRAGLGETLMSEIQELGSQL